MNKQSPGQTIKTTSIKSSKKPLLAIGSIALLIMLIVLGFYYFHFNIDDKLSPKQDTWGTFGDYVGGTLNPILSFLSLIALLWTISIQSNELELTRKELERSALAQEESKKNFDEQLKTLARQQFESTFFSLLDQHNKTLEHLIIPPSVNLSNRISYIQKHIFSNPEVTDLASAKAALEDKNSLCGHYFRVLYQLLKFIAVNTPGSKISQAFDADEIRYKEVTADEKMYSNIVRSLLSYSVTQLLSINCHCTDPTDTYWRYKLLIERYEFLEHMPFEVGHIDPIEHEVLVETMEFYELSAFGNSNFVKKYKNKSCDNIVLVHTVNQENVVS